VYDIAEGKPARKRTMNDLAALGILLEGLGGLLAGIGTLLGGVAAIRALRRP
jgi:hypothetical protein